MECKQWYRVLDDLKEGQIIEGHKVKEAHTAYCGRDIKIEAINEEGLGWSRIWWPEAFLRERTEKDDLVIAGHDPFIQALYNECKKTTESKYGESIKGVCLHKNSGKWKAYMNMHKKHRHLGVHTYKEDAIIQRLLEEQRLAMIEISGARMLKRLLEASKQCKANKYTWTEYNKIYGGII